MVVRKDVKWDLETDVVVLGSGGAALSAAILAADQDADVVMLEKSDQIGGTTAFSGGIPWIPMNRYMKEIGVEDSFEEAKKYITHLTGNKEPDPELVDVFINKGAEMIDYFHENTPLRFSVPRGYGDYYADNPGGKREGRSLDPQPFSLNELGEEWSEKIRRNPIFPPLTLEEGGAADPMDIDFNIVGERMEKNITTMGRALAGALFKAVLDRGVDVHIETPGRELVMNDDGEIIGVVAEKDGEDFFIGARKGVVIATGGFEWNKDLVASFLKGRVTHPQSPAHNEGDGLIMAMEVGAALANMSEAWWSPAFVDPTVEYEGRVYNLIDQPRAGANSIIVNKLGKRFVNEGSTYMDMPKAFYEYDQTTQTYPNEPPVYLIFDQQVKDRQLIATVVPGEDAPDWLPQADTIEELAEKIEIDPEQLKETVERFNENARNLEDPDFHKDKLFFGQMGTGFQGAEGTIGPIEKAPFYAMPIYFGALGTNGGPKINEHGQVINVRGKVIPGLYAAGNAAMGVLGPAYPGAGGTIGPAMTFGYLAGIHVGKSESKDI
ncbi:MAG TPA: FAD-binding protein [Pseudogracilibacillus sp.]|nr:FAD-binding protein [Pseudogracilibacillus sp.]